MGNACSSAPVDEEKSVVYSVLTDADADAAVDLASAVMGRGEPVFNDVLAAKGFDDTQRVRLIKDGVFGPMRDVLVAEGLTTIAKAGDKVIGCRFTVDWKHAPGPPPMPEELADYRQMWTACDDEWTASKGGLDAMKEGEWAHWVGLVVDPEFGQRGIATELYKQNLLHLKSKGFRGAVAETASNFSQRAAEKNGFKPFKQVKYADYTTSSGEKFFEPVRAPHTMFTLWEAAVESVVYSVLTDADADAAVDLASAVMGRGEPVFNDVLAARGFDDTQRVRLIKDGVFGPMRDILVAEGLTTIAKAGDKVIGCRFTVDWKHAPGPPPMPEELAEYRQMWMACDDEWTASKGGLDAMKEGEWAHWVGLVVDPEFGQRGIATELYKQNLLHLKSKGFRGAVAETASNFSQRAAEKNGFKPFKQVKYADYTTNSGEKFFEPVQAPHTMFTLWEAAVEPTLP